MATSVGSDLGFYQPIDYYSPSGSGCGLPSLAYGALAKRLAAALYSSSALTMSSVSLHQVYLVSRFLILAILR